MGGVIQREFENGNVPGETATHPLTKAEEHALIDSDEANPDTPLGLQRRVYWTFMKTNGVRANELKEMTIDNLHFSQPLPPGTPWVYGHPESEVKYKPNPAHLKGESFPSC